MEWGSGGARGILEAMSDKTETISPTSVPTGDLGSRQASNRWNRPHLVNVLGLRDPVSVRGGRDRRIGAIAKMQRGRVARGQLLQAGITDGMIHRMVAQGSLHRRYPGVYVVGHLAPIELEDETAALLACPDGAVLSHISAASLWRLRPEPARSEPVHVTLQTDTRVFLAGICSHRTRVLDRRDIRIHRGLPVTSPARTLVDNAGSDSPDELAQALDDALNREIVRPSEIRDMLERAGHGRRGAGLLRRMLDERDQGGRSRSHPERKLRSLLVAADLPHAEMNARILGYDVDFVWADLRVIVEVDGERYHSGTAKFESDRRRDQRLEAHGWTVIRITARQLEREPYAVIARLAAALALAEARLAA